MKLILLYFLIFLRISTPNMNFSLTPQDSAPSNIHQNQQEQNISPMMALDFVKECYAANFDKVYDKNTKDFYFYKLAGADYYLEYEGETGEDKNYIIHLYEFVVDDPDTGMGHTVTYGWYLVNRENGEITEQMQ